MQDHPALALAISQKIPIYPFFLWEPEWESEPDSDLRHRQFVWESLQNLNQKLLPFGAKVFLHRASANHFFEKIFLQQAPVALISHQETGNARTFARDRMVQELCQAHGVAWWQPKQQFVLRGLRSGRKDWPNAWKKWMQEPIPRVELSQAEWVTAPFGQEFGRNLMRNPRMQEGGESRATLELDHFLNKRIVKYSRYISKPEESQTYCSRLSPYLSWGCISSRSIYQITQKHMKSQSRAFRMQSTRFLSRLFWRDHMIQKFESECRMETENLNQAFDSFPKPENQDLLQAWMYGETGYPLVDACMRSLIATGYLNFRMRAMLVSFLTMVLWQDWRLGVHHLAKQFLDYEPGIHFFQFQMQAGTVGMHQLRIYNPYKQCIEQDPKAEFIQKWAPEWRKIPLPEIQKWGMEPSLFSFLGQNAPRLPIVPFESAYKRAKEAHFLFQKTMSVQKENQRIRRLHVNP